MPEGAAGGLLPGTGGSIEHRLFQTTEKHRELCTPLTFAIPAGLFGQ
jgi:hypothetical protein